MSRDTRRGQGELPKQLQGRWTAPLATRARQVLSSAPDSEALRDAFGEHVIDGVTYIDCRGLKVAGGAIMNLQAEAIDFSHGHFEYSLAQARLKNCRFVGVRYAEMNFTGEYIGCDFTGANFRRTSMTARFRMEGCDFTQADCSGCEWSLATLHGCRFVETKFKAAELTLCKFVNCTFSNPDVTGAYVAGCSFLEPHQNMRWFDAVKKVEMTHVVRADAPWVDWHGANISDVRIK